MKLLVVDDHPLMLEGLAQLVAQALPQHAVLRAANFAEASCIIAGAAQPGVVLLDPGLPDLSGRVAIQSMVNALPEGAVVVISANDQPHNQEAAWAAGAHSFISKAAQPEELISGLRAIALGQRVLICRYHGMTAPPKLPADQYNLSARQFAVLAAMCAGHPNKVIAQRLDISEKTVKGHMGAVFERLGVSNRTQAALVARRMGLVTDDATPPKSEP
jgi:DNA-binding NarL/FixJ family response regulator